MSSFEGLLPAALTPMNPNGDVDLRVVSAQAAYFSQVGAAGVFINGTTAEWTSLTVSERKSITKEWTAHANDDLLVIDHVGHHCHREAIALAQHAADCGVFGISVVAPSYFIFNSAQDIVDWCAPIAAAAGDLPFYYYDLPQLTGVSVPAFDVALLAKEEIPTFAGIKYSGTDPVGLQRCMGLGDYDIFWGSDENLVVGMSLGCKAAVGSTYNLMIPHYSKIMEAFFAGDTATAQRLQRVSLQAVECMIPHGVIPSLKALQPLVGYSVGSCRLPFHPLSEGDTLQLKEAITALGILD